MNLTPYALYLISKPKPQQDYRAYRRAYRREWMRRKRAAAQASAPPSPSTSFLETASSRLTHSTT
jgi:hypothetical protein